MSLAPTSLAPVRRLVLFHGMASAPREFGLLVHPLQRLGVTLLTPEVKGYSHASLSDPARWQDWVSEAAEVVDTIASQSEEPFVLGGLCAGAMLAVAAASHRVQPKLSGLALLSPLFAYDGWGLPWWYRLRYLAYALGLERRFAMRERPPYGLKNERLREWVRKQIEADQATMVGPSKVSLQVVRESERLSRRARASLPQLPHPILVMHAREDEICDLRSVHSALSAIAPGRLRMDVLENSYHMIPADNDRQHVANTLASFLATGVARMGNARSDLAPCDTEDGVRRTA